MNWESHVPIQWKFGTLKNLVKMIIFISSDQYLLQTEVDYFKKVFVKINEYPSKAVEKIIKNKLQ